MGRGGGGEHGRGGGGGQPGRTACAAASADPRAGSPGGSSGAAAICRQAPAARRRPSPVARSGSFAAGPASAPHNITPHNVTAHPAPPKPRSGSRVRGIHPPSTPVPARRASGAARDMPRQETGSGLSKAELGLRLRYEIRREFAPYVGVTWERAYGRTADFARTGGRKVTTTGVVAGIRGWF